MTRQIKAAAIFIFCLLFFSLTAISVSQAQIELVSVPTVIKLETANTDGPLLTGLTVAGTEVLIYLDGSYVDLAAINQSGEETDNYYFKFSDSLTAGQHKLVVIARNKTSLLLSAPSAELTFQIKAPPAPTMIAPNQDTVTGKVKPLITGLTVSGTLVKVYIDGIYNGKSEILIDDSGAANFAYQPFLNLAPGNHTAWAVAEDRAGRQSQVSRTLNFTVEQPLPAPIVKPPLVQRLSEASRPFIVGLAKNDTLIKVYIDQQLAGQFKVENHQSGTASFAFQPDDNLSKGSHMIYTTATDSRGKESSWSNLVYFSVRQPSVSFAAVQDQPVNSPAPAAETDELAAIAISSSDQAAAGPSASTMEQTGEPVMPAVETKQDSVGDTNIEQLVQAGSESVRENTGLIDEDEQNQGRIQLNLVIFIVFVLAVIGWIFWVNRELIKERQAKSDNSGLADEPNNYSVSQNDNLRQESPRSRQQPPQQPPLV